MSLPKLSSEQRADYLEQAAAARKRRAVWKAALPRRIAGGLTVAGAISEAKSDATLERMRVPEFLCALPGIGPVRADKLMDAHGIANNRHMRGLGERQARALAGELDERYGGKR